MKLHSLTRTIPLAVAAVLLLSACAEQTTVTASLKPTVQLIARADPPPMPVMKPVQLPESIPGVPGTKEPVQERADVVRMGHLSCVPFARMWSGIQLRGNAHTWWAHAKGHYTRAHKPEVGAVIVFSRTRRLHLGHVAVVRRVINSREIRVDHSNWGNRGRIYLNARVIDVSAKNDWSRVKVWNTPLNTMGSRSYKVSGFILPHEPTAKTS